MTNPEKPKVPPLPTADQVPTELRDLKRWIGWRYTLSDKGWKKPPYSPKTGEGIGATQKYKDHFVTFAEAVVGLATHDFDGVGFVFVEGDGFVGIDFDDCRDPATGVIHPAVETWLRWFGTTYQEVSVSGTGVHVVGKGAIAKSLRPTPLPDDPGVHVEIYDHDRYFTWSGQRLGDVMVIAECRASLDKLFGSLGVAATDPRSAPDQQHKPLPVDVIRELHAKNLESLRAAAPGTRNTTLNTVAFFAGRAFAAGALEGTEAAVKQAVKQAALAAGIGDQEIEGTGASGWGKGITQPLHVLDIAHLDKTTRPDMPDTMLCGKLGELCRTRLADFPIAYAWLAVLAAASALVKPRDKLRCNINVCLVGDVHSGKSQAQERANYLFQLKELDLLKEVKYGSAEGLLEDVGDRQGQPVLWFPDELSHVLEKAQIQGASFPYILNTLFYKDRNELTVQHRKKVNFNARMSIAGGLVEENFGDSFGAATTSGLYDRFLFGLYPTGNFEYSYRPMEGTPLFEVRAAQIGTLFDSVPVPVAPVKVMPDVNPDVWEARDAIRQAEGIDPRILELALRVALICAAWDEKSELRASYLKPAWELARYQQRVRVLLQPNPGRNFEAMAAYKVISFLKQHVDDGRWLVWRDVLRATHIMEYGPSVASRAVSELIFAGEVEEVSIQGKKGGPKKRLVRLTVDE